MSSTTDYINKPTIQFVEYVANNVVSEFRSSPGMNMSALMNILSIKFSSNPMAGAFASSVRTHGNNFPSNVGYPSNNAIQIDPRNRQFNHSQYYGPGVHTGYHDPRPMQVYQRSSTPSRDSRNNHYNEPRGRSMNRDEQRPVRGQSAHRQSEPVKRSSTPARHSRDSRDDDARSTTSSHDSKANSERISKPVKKTIEKPSNVGLKLFTIEQSPIIKSQVNIPENLLPAEAKRRWSFLTDSERAVYAQKQVAYDEKVNMEKLSAKAAERDGFKIFFSETFDLLKSQGVTFEPGKKKIEINKRWGKLSPEERAVYASKQRERDEQLRLFIESKVASGAWPQPDEKTLRELKELRNGQVYMVSFNYTMNIVPMLSMMIFSPEHFFQLSMNIDNSVNNLVVDRTNVIPVKTLDFVIDTIFKLTGVSIKFPGVVMNSEAKTLWINFLKSEDSKVFGYTKYVPKTQVEENVEKMENLQTEPFKLSVSQQAQYLPNSFQGPGTQQAPSSPKSFQGPGTQQAPSSPKSFQGGSL